jgi:hypothetical protein
MKTAQTPERPPPGRTLMRVLAAMGVLAGAGCVSSKYKLAKPDGTSPVAINLAGREPPGEVVVHSVIVYQGPGSWKREAFWDEYVLTVTNRGGGPLVVDSAELVGREAQVVKSGDDPWVLDKESRSWWKQVRSSQGSSLIALGAGTAVAAVVATNTLALLNATAGLSAVGVGASFAAVSTGATVAAVALPVYAVSIVAINHRNKGEVAAEFNRRRLALPATLAPGQNQAGSLFFRITPAPRQLVLRGRSDGQPWAAGVDLAPLVDLHLQPAANANTAASSPR